MSNRQYSDVIKEYIGKEGKFYGLPPHAFIFNFKQGLRGIIKEVLEDCVKIEIIDRYNGGAYWCHISNFYIRED